MKLTNLFFFVTTFILTTSCSQDKKAVIESALKPKKDASTQKTGPVIQGNFSNSNKTLTAKIIKTKSGQGNPLENGTPDEFSVIFLNSDIPNLEIGCCEGTLINEGDLNGDGKDELSTYQSPMNGNSYLFSTFTLKSGKWRQLIEPILLPLADKPFQEKDLEQIVFKDKDAIYFLSPDLNDENFKLVKHKTTLN